MKLILSALISALCWSCRLAAASADTHVYTFDVGATRETPPYDQLRPQEARMVLAQRVGVEYFHAIDLDDAESVKQINAFGRRDRLFSQAKAENVLVLVEGIDEQLMSLDQPRFTISPSPFANATHGLFLDLARQAFPEYLASLPDHEVTTLLKGGAISRNEHGSLQIGIWTHKEIISYMRELLGKNSPSDGLSLTIITTPSTADNNAHTTDFGTYSMPSNTRQSLLHSKRQQPSESPLEEEPTVQPTTANTSPLTTLASSVDPLPGILPACFSSQSACESTTRNCSGHGVCGKKYTDKSAEGDSKFKDCYACECKATKRDMGEGKVQTTYWGGPACQKKDVSVQFWLIALFSVAMVGLVSFAVGTVWSMGDEELPSVIGAGVSGPVRRS